MTTGASLFTGGGLVEIGMIAVGIKPLWGIEWDNNIADVARANGLHVITADVRHVDPATLDRPGVLHASPPCPNFSTANQSGSETTEDIELAQATARFIEALLPSVFTLENVYAYRKSASWALIADALNRCGYWYDLAHVSRLTLRAGDEPSFTVTNASKAYPRAWLSRGRIVTMTPRALARFQSIPDSYTLPDKRTLACRVIGNAVPPLLYEKLICNLVEGVANA